jgi:hypothetical protein
VQGWLEAIIFHQHDREHNLARSYFQTYFVLLRSCPGHDQTRNHLNLKRLTAATSFNLTADMSESYQGDTAAWFRSMVRINREPEDSPSCWRNIDDDGAKTCSGAATVLKLILGIPVMLILELPADWDGQKSNQWSFPDHIRPLTAGAETMHGVVYDIVGRGLTNGGHFKAIFTPDGKHTYCYDGDDNGGCAILTPNVNLAGRMPPKSGWRTYAVIYHLRGGTRAQAFFSKC